MLTKNMKQKTFFSIVTRWNGYGLKGDVSFGCPQQATLYSRTLFWSYSHKGWSEYSHIYVPTFG